ncbi:MAG: alanine racemase [Clostridia bacterium]|nr:alanine racemase [Clostridia bacterium]
MNIIDNKKTRLIVDLEKVAHNYRYGKKLANGAKVAGVVKADAYGNGAVAVARRLAKEGCDFFAVANIDEALELRENGIEGLILVLGYVLDDYIENAIENDVSLALDSSEHLKKIIETAAGRPVKIHIKADTGMNRTGYNAKGENLCGDLILTSELIKSNKNVICEGLFTHLATADVEGGDDFARLQAKRLKNTENKLREIGINPQIVHLSNSAGLAKFSSFGFDAVRMGMSLYYGYSTDDKNFEHTTSFKTKVINVHEMKKGEGVSYGQKFVAEKDMTIAIIGAGFADGLCRSLSYGRGSVIIRGERFPIIGLICMDMAMIDPMGKKISVGDDVTIFGEDGGDIITVEEIAKAAGRTPYEITCGISKRVPRVYK